MRTWLRVLGAVAILLVLAPAAVFGPALLRTDEVRYEWGGEIGAKELEAPIGLTRVGARLYVSDAARNAVLVFDTAGHFVEEWRDEEGERFNRPMNIRTTSDSRLLLAEYLSDRITVLETDGTVVRRIGGRSGSAVGELDAPGGAAAAGQAIYVADFFNHRVQAFGPEGDARIIGIPGPALPGRILPGRLHYPTDVAGGGDSLIYVADAYNNRIQVFDTEGRRVRGWGGPLGSGLPGGFRGWFRVATGVEVIQDTVYAADFYNHRIQIFTAHGRYLGQAADSLHLPTSAVTGEHGELYVADFGHGRIVRFRRSR